MTIVQDLRASKNTARWVGVLFLISYAALFIGNAISSAIIDTADSLFAVPDPRRASSSPCSSTSRSWQTSSSWPRGSWSRASAPNRHMTTRDASSFPSPICPCREPSDNPHTSRRRS